MAEFFCVIGFLFFIREADLDQLNTPVVFMQLSDGLWRDLVFTLLLLYIIVRAFIEEGRAVWKKALTCLKAPYAWAISLGGLLLITGSFCEDTGWLLGEELLELNGALIIVCSSLILLNRLPAKDIP